MVQIFLTYTASKFVINSALFSCWQISAYFFQVLVWAPGRAEGRRLRHSNVIRSCDHSIFFSVFRGFLLGFPLFPFAIPFFLAVLSCPFLPPFLPRLPSFAPSGFSLPAWISMILLWFCSWFLILFVHPYPTYPPMATRPFPCPSRTSSFSPPTLLCKPQDLTGSGGRRAICPSQ